MLAGVYSSGTFNRKYDSNEADGANRKNSIHWEVLLWQKLKEYWYLCYALF